MERLPDEWRTAMDEIEEASAGLARDRAHAFYGDEEALVPSGLKEPAPQRPTRRR
jgi:hypothetical protein